MTYWYDVGGDRCWMQNDHLIDFDDSTRPTEDVMRRNAIRGNLRFVPPGTGNLISSMVEADRHRPIIDLDIPHMYVPSSTTGHGHLYLDGLEMNDATHFTFMAMLHHYGVVKDGTLAQVKAHNMTLARPPHVRKRYASTPPGSRPERVDLW